MQQDWVVKKCLSAPLSQNLGQYVYLVEKNQQQYVLKFLSNQASIVAQQAFQYEQAQYRRFTGHHFCLDFDIIAKPAEIKLKSDGLLPQPNSAILILPYVKTISLTECEQLNQDERIVLFEQICSCVSQLHDLGWVHGDLKLQHIAWQKKQLKLLDFAQTVPFISSESVQSLITATPAYMAPELFHGESKSIASDIYALGILFFELLSGHKPYQASSYLAWAQAHCQQALPLLPKQYEIYQFILDKMLMKIKKNRFGDLKSVMIALNLIKKK